MRKSSKLGLLTLLLCLVLALPGQAHAQAAAAAKASLKSKAALKFADLLAGYLLGKTLDTIYASATQPDPKQLDLALGSFQKDHPEYTVMLGTLRRAVKTDGSGTSREEFERLAQDLVFQMDHSLLTPAKAPTPSLPWTPSATPLTLRNFNLNLPGARAFDGLPLLVPLRDESMLAAKIVGAWSFSHRSNAGPGADVYIFHRDGKITEYKVFGEEVFSFKGTYTVEGKKLSLRWELPNGSGDLLTATIEELDGGHLKYTADKGLFELVEPAPKTLTRISDVGYSSVVTLSNPTRYTLMFEVRWATVDGFLTPWEPVKFEPGDMWSLPYRGGFFCQVTFDTSFDEGRQEKTYELPFNVVASPADPKLLDEGGYRIRFEDGKIDLVSEKLTLSQPAPGVR